MSAVYIVVRDRFMVESWVKLGSPRRSEKEWEQTGG